MTSPWPPVAHETLPWVSTLPTEYLTRRQRAELRPTFEATVPPSIAEAPWTPPAPPLAPRRSAAGPARRCPGCGRRGHRPAPRRPGRRRSRGRPQRRPRAAARGLRPARVPGRHGAGLRRRRPHGRPLRQRAQCPRRDPVLERLAARGHGIHDPGTAGLESPQLGPGWQRRLRRSRGSSPGLLAPRPSWTDGGRGARPATAKARYMDVGQYFSEHRTIIALPAGDHVRQRSAAAIDSTVNLGGQPSSRGADARTCGFTVPDSPI